MMKIAYQFFCHIHKNRATAIYCVLLSMNFIPGGTQ